MKTKLLVLILLLTGITVSYSQDWNATRVYKTESSIIYDLCFSKNGNAIGITDNNTIKVFSVDSGKLLNEYKNGHKGQVQSIDISQDSITLVSGGKDSTIVIWDLLTGTILHSLSYQKGLITSVHISSDGNYLVSGATDNNVFLYDIKKNVIIHKFTDHTDFITSVKFSPDGKLIASASGDKLINIYDVKTLRILGSLSGHDSWVRDISFSSDGKKLISCGDDSRILIWDISDLNRIRKLDDRKVGHSWLSCLDLYKDNYSFVSGSISGEVKIQTPVGDYKSNIKKPIQKVLFRPSESYYLTIAMATIGNGVILLEAKNMK